MSHSCYICYKDASKLFCIGNNVYKLFKQRPLIKDLKIPPLILWIKFYRKVNLQSQLWDRFIYFYSFKQCHSTQVKNQGLVICSVKSMLTHIIYNF